MKRESRPNQPAKRASEQRIIRAVASSSAIETGRSVAELEAKLKAGNSKFKHLTLSY